MSNNWWATKLGTTPQQPQYQQPTAPQYVAPQPAQYAAPQQPQYPPQQQMTPQAPRCPGCGSGNYGSLNDAARGMQASARCYDCGYPLQQSGSGLGKGIMGQGGGGGAATPAKQVATGGYNPGTIIGHI
jgi:hypothetical protein